MIRSGARQSPTLDAELRALDQSDIVVFLEPSISMTAELGGYMSFLTTTSTCRFVRIRFNVRVNEKHALSIIGHEIQHALEVAQHPEVVNPATLADMYKRYYKPSCISESYDSDEAIGAGNAVMRELR